MDSSCPMLSQLGRDAYICTFVRLLLSSFLRSCLLLLLPPSFLFPFVVSVVPCPCAVKVQKTNIVPVHDTHTHTLTHTHTHTHTDKIATSQNCNITTKGLASLAQLGMAVQVSGHAQLCCTNLHLKLYVHLLHHAIMYTMQVESIVCMYTSPCKFTMEIACTPSIICFTMQMRESFACTPSP